MEKKQIRKNDTQKTRVFLADPSSAVLRALADLINMESDMRVCGQAGSAAAALKSRAARTADAAVVDLDFNDMHGFEFLRLLRRFYPRMPILVVSLQNEAVYGPRALAAGADAYLMKDRAAAGVVAAIRRLLIGRPGPGTKRAGNGRTATPGKDFSEASKLKVQGSERRRR